MSLSKGSAGTSRSDGPKIFLRHDQTIDLASKAYHDNNVLIVAPDWVRQGLRQLSDYVPAGTEFNVYGNRNRKVTSITIKGALTLKDLVMIARNEPVNLSGAIEYQNYEPTIAATNKKVIYAIKDLVRQCVIVACDETTHYGGYPMGRSRRIEQRERVYVADLAGLQFQLSHNSGRLVLIGNDFPDGLLDSLIFKEVVGEDKKSYDDASKDTSGRYVKHGEAEYFDTVAYEKFVANDVLVSGLAFNEIANDPLNFKFLKYGTGFFAGGYSTRSILEKHIYNGVANGLDKLFASSKQKWIKRVELPFYVQDQLIERVCQKHGVECKFSKDDALKATFPEFKTATTNCADPHVITGNEMGYASVDAAIAENLKSKGNIFSPILNPLIGEKFLHVDPAVSQKND